MAARRIQLDVDGVSATAELQDESAPKTAEALWQSLPIEAELTMSKWSGAASCFRLPDGPLAELTELESPVCSIYPGTLVVARPTREALIGHGLAEYRRHVGTDYATPAARIVENRTDFLRVLARMRDEGAKRLSIRRLD